jgi:hypothetical protein
VRERQKERDGDRKMVKEGEEGGWKRVRESARERERHRERARARE